MIESVKSALTTQYEATLWMLRDCIKKCPESHWNKPIAKYPFWQVAYHSLCFVDLYLSAKHSDWKPQAIHPKGVKELSDEYPSRRFEKAELLEYTDYCRDKALKQIPLETPRSLARPTTVPWYKVNRLELHMINLRHAQHHVGQLSAHLRKAKKSPKWSGNAWKS